MTGIASHPYAQHLRNGLAQEMPTIPADVLESASHVMAMISSLAMSTKSSIMLLNIGDALRHNPLLRAKNVNIELAQIEPGLDDITCATGQCIITTKDADRSQQVSGTFTDILDTLTLQGARSAYVIMAMDDGQVRLHLGSTTDDGFSGPCSNFMHCEDIPH